MYEILFYGMMILIVGVILGHLSKEEKTTQCFVSRSKTTKRKRKKSGWKKWFKDLDIHPKLLFKTMESVAKLSPLVHSPARINAIQWLYNKVHWKNIPYTVAYNRLKYGYTVEEVVCTPVRQWRW